METLIHSITVYCSSSNSILPVYLNAGAELGRAIAENKWTLIYGGNSIGMMQMLADAVRSGGGSVVGVTPKLFVDQGYDDKLCQELIVTEDLRSRKHILAERGDAFIALPGGIGTLEEIIEVLSAKALKLHNKPIVLLNINGYWDPLLAMFEHGISQKFMKPRLKELYYVAPTVSDAIGHLKTAT